MIEIIQPILGLRNQAIYVLFYIIKNNKEFCLIENRLEINEICWNVLNGVDEFLSFFIKVDESNIKFSNFEQK